MNIAQTLRKLMDERKLSNSKLAREIGVHTSTVSNWLDGKEVKAENLTALCTYFGCSLDYLAGKTEETKKETTPGNGDGLDEILERLRARPECRMLFKLADGATPDDVQKAAAIIEALRKVEGK